MDNKSKTISKRIFKDKAKLLELLIKVPIVQVACEKLGIGRATYYRWRKADEKFALDADEAIQYGKYYINDMAESQLINQIKEQNMTAIIFWLKKNHSAYADRLQITAKAEKTEGLSEEQKAIVEKALKMGTLHSIKEKEEDNE